MQRPCAGAARSPSGRAARSFRCAERVRNKPERRVIRRSLPGPSVGDGPESLVRTAGAPHEVALFLDVDGTLVRIAATPDEVMIEDGTVELLARAQRATGGALALISGRPIATLDSLFAPLVLPAAGQHGLERRDTAGVVRLHAKPPPQLASYRARLEAFARQYPGVLIEDKQIAIGAHYRLAPQAESELATLVTALAEESQGTLVIQRGKMIFELRPNGKNKGTAIAEFMEEPAFVGRTPVFIGDDLTDEYGFSFVNKLGGVSVKVGPGATEA